MIQRKKTRPVNVGTVKIGGNAPVSVQSMTCTKTEDISSTVAQIKQLQEAGCEIVRVAVPSSEAAQALRSIKEQISIPLVADIHFDYRLAIQSIENGADKIRINPGNIGSEQRVKSVLKKAKEYGIPVRIGVNSGSLEKDLLDKYGQVCAEALVESAIRHIGICTSIEFQDLVISVKASHVPLMIETNRLISEKIQYPIHLGVTEAGTSRQGILRSSVGIGALLSEGIGDTIRVSLTGDPVQEVKAGFDILRALELRKTGITLISCPTCGRTQANIVEIAETVESALSHIKKPITVAVMGCAVNGPGEARTADIGVACGKGTALLFRKGEVVEKIPEKDILSRLVKEVESWRESD
ncbi:flavodoxin-dependent (E)-4-hydroxy-3-methylbut-2-enyl-diphosphate synthase [bacterium]|nr:flavodoxin-dependent (E)-4-hydroxy-3-methylbut-2-enyl-diphosphate synthase [bacterium]